MAYIGQIYSQKTIKKIIASGVVSNILETYDLILISLMATTLGDAFFPPAKDSYSNLVDILYVFLLGLLVRPIGNIVMGAYADQIGRKNLMVISLMFTGFGTAFIGLLPTYSCIGIWSTTLFVLFRVCQNFFAGITYINSAAYLIENGEEKQKGFYGSWCAIGISGGYLFASLVVLVISSLISKNLIPEWSWRFVFLFSISGVLFGFWARLSVPESIVFVMNNACTETPKKWSLFRKSFAFIKEHPMHSLSISAITFLGVCLSFVYYMYIPIFLKMTRGFSQNETFFLNALCLLFVVMLIPIFGKLSDYYNRIALLKIVCFSMLILAMPFFWIAVCGSYAQVLFLSILISIPASCFFSLYPVLITESFPSQIRCTTASLIYQIVVSVEMGALPLFFNYLVKTTQKSYAPGYLLIVATLIGFFGLVFLERTSTQTQPKTNLLGFILNS